jgi:polar amino acid transport system substrate-binding protein
MTGRLLVAVVVVLLRATDSVSAQTPLRWGADAEGGAPLVEADPRDPSRMVGFDVEIAELISRELGRPPRFVQVAFTSLDQSALRGDFDIGLGGIEDSAARRQTLGVSVPYFEFREVLTVRNPDRHRYRSLASLRGARVATLGGTLAYELLRRAEQTDGLTAVSYDDDVHPYEDLALGRVDAVLLDHILAERAVRRTTGLVIQPDALAVGHYVVVTAPDQGALLGDVNRVLLTAMADGRLEQIFRKWQVWNDDQPVLHARVRAEGAGALGGGDTPTGASAPIRGREALERFAPQLLRAAVVTLALSCAAMVLAVLLGVAIATGRVYGHRVVRAALLVYVEVVRGTPVLLQLFLIYYGLAGVIRLPAFLAALLGLALNYAAYESEIYRSALEAIPAGQLEAARMLGFSRWQTLRLIRGPQALRLALAPMTNDFVALLKDSSLVSVLTVVELTKQTQIMATNIGSWLVPGLACGALYLLMSLPLSHLARRLETQWKLEGA